VYPQLGKLLPSSLDNNYRGSRVALWLFGVVVAVRCAQSLSVIFNGYNIAQSADGIPVSTYTPEAAQQIVALFGQGSIWRLTFGVFCIIALILYRSAVPLLLALLALNYLGAQLLYRYEPLLRTGTPPGPYVNLGLFVLSIAGLLLSMRQRKTSID
jgi:hypothetical protein